MFVSLTSEWKPFTDLKKKISLRLFNDVLQLVDYIDTQYLNEAKIFLKLLGTLYQSYMNISEIIY